MRFNLYELIGVILGDGSITILPNKGIYRLEISGNAEDGEEYFLKISNFIFGLSGKRPKIRIRNERLGKSLRLTINSKKFIFYLVDKLKIPYRNKTFESHVPDQFLKWLYCKHIIRGLFETDGSIYFSRIKKSKFPKYPRIEIKTSSKKLTEQIYLLLKQKAFKVRIRTCKSDKTIGIYVSGKAMIEKWVKEIGFGSKRNESKYLFWKKTGYYIPYMTYKERISHLSGGGQAV